MKPAKPKPRKPEPVLSPEDRDAWSREVSSVRKLAPAPARVPSAKRRHAAPAASRIPAAPSTFVVSDDGERMQGGREGDAKNLQARLRRGEFPVHGELDLHGLREAEAERAVERFLVAQSRARSLAVVIVHGRGRGSEGGRGVLRDAIAGWLSKGRAAGLVRAFVTAPEARGGAGAVLVLLAAPRPERRQP